MRTRVALLAVALLVACLKDKAPTGVDATSARLGLRFQVVTTPGSQLHIQIYYLDQGPTAAGTPAFLLDQVQPIGTGTTSFPLTVDLSPCLTDPHRQTAGPQCELFVSVALIRNGVTVDSVTLAPVPAVPGQVINVTPTISVSAIGSVVVVPATDTVGVGGTVQLGDTVRDINGAIVPGHAVTWISGDTTIAHVDTGGNVTGVKIGTTKVTAKAGSQSASATVVVIKGASIVASQDTVAFTGNVKATGGGNLVTVTLASSDTAVVIQGLAVGTITYGAGQPTGWVNATIFQNLGAAVKRRRPGVLMGSRVRHISPLPIGGAIVTPAYLELSVSDSLRAGTYTATVPVTAAGVAPATIHVTYTLTDAPLIALSPTTLQFNQYASGSTVAPAQTVAVSNSSVGTLGTVSVAFTSYGSATSGWLNTTVNGNTISVQPNTTALPLGPDSAFFYVIATNAVNQYQQVTVNISSAVTFAKVVTGNAFACGLTTGGTVYCWGDNTYGQLGNATPGFVQTPVYVAVPGVTAVTAPALDIAAGARHACVVAGANSTAFCWGDNTRGQAGVAPAGGIVTTPTAVGGIGGATTITAGGAHTCVTQSGIGYCWGDNSAGQLGIGVADSTARPTPLAVSVSMTAISAGLAHTCSVNAGNLFCWGSDSAGQVGDDSSGIGRVVTNPRPINVLDLSGLPVTVATVSAGGAHTCAIDANKNAYCWGNNTSGQLGNLTTGAPNAHPSPVANSFTANLISAGYDHTCAISAAGGAYCWGANQNGQLGVGGPGVSRPAPIFIVNGNQGTFTTISASATGDATCDIAAPIASCFGFNIAIANTVDPSPVQVPGQPAAAGVTAARVRITVRPGGRR
jgi:alpha-tubulin suppressor-like RCC1 family protein